MNKKRIIPSLIVITILLPIFVQALGFGTAQVNVTDMESGINKIVLPDGTEVNAEEVEYEINGYGVYKFVAYDNAGNMTEEFIIETPNIGENTDIEEIEDIIKKIEDDISKLEDGVEKDKLIEELNKLKEKYDDELKSRIDELDKRIEELLSDDEAEEIEIKISRLPEEYKTDKYSPSLLEEKNRLSKDLKEKLENTSNQSDLELAISLVEKAEKSLDQEDLYSARDKVNSLSDGKEKSKLNDRLDKVEGLINKIQDIEKEIQGAKDLEQIKYIQDKINKLPNGELKDYLQKQLDNKTSELEAINSGDKNLRYTIEAVKKAERTLKQIDLDMAWIKVRLLPEGRERDDLSDRLNIVQELIFAIEQIERDIDKMKDLEERWIQREISRLPYGSERDRLEYKLEVKLRELGKLASNNKDLELAKEAVETAELSLLQRDVDVAWKLVNKLDDSRDKDRLKDRLDRLQALINGKGKEEQDLEEIIKLVEKAEESLDQVDVNIARIRVHNLPPGVLKDSLNKRLDIVQNLINEATKEKEGTKGKEDKDLIKEIEDAIKKAEDTLSNKDIENAREKIQILEDGPKKDLFNEKLILINEKRELKLEYDRLKKEREKLEATQTQKPKDTKVIYNNTGGTSSQKSSGPSTNSNYNSTHNSDYSRDIYQNDREAKDIISVDNNPYYKKPIREKQSKFFKLKEPNIVKKEVEDMEPLEVEEDIKDIESVSEVVEQERTKRSKLPIVILLMILSTIGGVVFIFIKRKKEEAEE